MVTILFAVLFEILFIDACIYVYIYVYVLYIYISIGLIREKVQQIMQYIGVNSKMLDHLLDNICIIH